jgi:hypothetical protein
MLAHLRCARFEVEGHQRANAGGPFLCVDVLAHLDEAAVDVLSFAFHISDVLLDG